MSRVVSAAALVAGMLTIAAPARAIVIDSTTSVGDSYLLDFLLQPGDTDNGGNTLGGTVNLTAEVSYEVTAINFDSSVSFKITIKNTTSGFDERITSFGFDTSPQISITSFTGGAIFDGYAEDSNFPSFQNIEFCTFPDGCSGGNFHHGLAPGQTDTIMMSLSWGGSDLTVDPSVVKFQGDLGSFEFAGGECERDCVKVPEPNSLSLLSLSLLLGAYVVRRRRSFPAKRPQV